MLKKIIALLPVLALMLVLVVPARAGAIQTMQEGSHVGVPYGELSDFEDYNIRDYYVMFNGFDIANSGSSPRPYYVSNTFFFSFNDDDFEITEDDGVYDFVPLTERGTDWRAVQFYIRYFTDDMSVYNTYYYAGSGDFDFAKFRYDSNNHTVSICTSPYGSLDTPSYTIGDVYIFESNCEALQSGLNIDVTFTPELSGAVDRSLSSGSSYYSESFTMSVTNNTRTPIQYSMSIYIGNDVTRDNLLFKYVSNEWVYGKLVGTLKQMKDQTANYSVQHKGTYWHWVGTGDTSVQVFKWSQIDFNTDDTYTCVVEAVPTSLDKSSEFFTSGLNVAASMPEYVLDSEAKQVVYSSTFTIKYLDDVVYNPNDYSNGVIPNSSSEDINRALNTRDAMVNDDGSIDYTSYNAYDDPDSALNTFGASDPYGYSNQGIVVDNIVSGGSSSGMSGIRYSGNSFSNLSGTVSGFFGFLSAIFTYLPSSFMSLLMLGLTAMIVVGIVKAVK